MTDGPIHVYRARIQAGILDEDPAQALLAEKLQSLHRALRGFQPASGHAAWKARFGLSRRRGEPPQGLYIYGGVGVGKSMLMDLFFEDAPVAAKRRVHFHEFLGEVQARLHERRKRGGEGKADPIPPIAAEIAQGAALLCFDEFQVETIQDAMLLGRLFEALFAEDVVVVATSNRPPQDLYENGLQRDRFLPFIELICRRLDVLALASAKDYRLDRLRGRVVYFSPAGDAAEGALEDCFARLAGGRTPCAESVTVKGRTIAIPQAIDGVAKTDFPSLCSRALGAADYLAIAERYHTLILSRIPRMDAERKNEAKRFVHLIDALYERKVNLICSAEVPPEALYPEGDVAFAFARTASRLIEMQSDDYLAQAHRHGGAGRATIPGADSSIVETA